MASTTSTGMRKVIDVMGRSFASRIFKRSDNILHFLLLLRHAGGNNTDGDVLDLDMHHEQQTRAGIEADGRVARLILARRLHQHKERVAKYLGRLFEPDAMLALVQLRLGSIPDKRIGPEGESERPCSKTSICIDYVNTFCL